jgi:large subunit ribosomal protein L24
MAREMKIHNGDTVTVISGKDKGVTGKVISVDHDRKMVVVEGVNLAYKHVKPSQKNPNGGRLHKETPIRACKVMVVCPKTNKPTRIGYRYLDDGTKERFARISQASLGVVSPAKKSYAK